MSKVNWEVNLRWVKAHAGIMGNELADTRAKKGDEEWVINLEYNRIPKSVVTREFEEESVRNGKETGQNLPKEAQKKNIFKRKRKTKKEFKLHTKLHNSNRTWKNKSVPTPI
jgi:hypothetical protein